MLPEGERPLCYAFGPSNVKVYSYRTQPTRRAALPKADLQRKTLACGPLIDDEAEVVKLLDEGFDVAADFWAVFGAGLGGLGDGDDATIAPCGGRQGDEGLGEVGGTQLHLLAAGGLGAEHGSLADGAGIGVCECDAEVEGVGVDGEKGIDPGAGLAHIDIHAF